MKIFACTALILLLGLAPAAAQMSSPFLQCDDGRSCMEKKVDYGFAEITCTEADTRSSETWNCEYEWGYNCRLGNTNEFRKGGLLPVMSRVCSDLCGPCKSGWK